MTKELEFHPLSNIFPLMEGEEFDALVADVKVHGLAEPITLLDGRILDGRNRYRAYLVAGCKLRTEEHFTETHDCGVARDPAGYVISKNIHRRHLTAEQKRDLIAKVIAATPEKSDREIARALKTDHKKVGRVRKAKEATGAIAPVEKRVGKDGKARKQPSKKRASDPEASAETTKAQLTELDDAVLGWADGGFDAAKLFRRSEVENNAELAKAAAKTAEAWSEIAGALSNYLDEKDLDEKDEHYEGSINKLVTSARRSNQREARRGKKNDEQMKEFRAEHQAGIDALAARLVEVLDIDTARSLFCALAMRGPCGFFEGYNLFLAVPLTIALGDAIYKKTGLPPDPEVAAQRAAKQTEDEIIERDRKECIALNQKVLDAERERDAAVAAGNDIDPETSAKAMRDKFADLDDGIPESLRRT